MKIPNKIFDEMWKHWGSEIYDSESFENISTWLSYTFPGPYTWFLVEDDNIFSIRMKFESEADKLVFLLKYV